jgi:hypothetical protein
MAPSDGLLSIKTCVEWEPGRGRRTFAFADFRKDPERKIAGCFCVSLNFKDSSTITELPVCSRLASHDFGLSSFCQGVEDCADCARSSATVLVRVVIAVLVVLAIGVLLAFLLVLRWRERSDLSVEPEGMEEFAEDLSFTTFDEWSEAPTELGRTFSLNEAEALGFSEPEEHIFN